MSKEYLRNQWMKIIVGMVFLVTSCVHSSPAPDPQATHSEDCYHDQTSFRCVGYVSNYDGDTFKPLISGVPDFISKLNVRVRGVDTPEMRNRKKHRRGRCERALASRAKEFTRSVLSSAKRIDLLRLGWAQYRRIEADVLVDGRDLATMIVEQKFGVVASRHKKRRTTDKEWCRLLHSH